MSKFVVFTNANAPFEGKPIVINVNNIVTIYRDILAGNKVALWSKENFWHIEEDFNTVMEKIGLDYKEEIEEAEFKGKDVPLNKPKRGGPKAYYVYVKDGDKVKKVTFGSGGLRAKIKNKEARNAFAARHNCKDKKDRTKPGYWSCNLPRYAQALGLGANMNTFWSLLWMIVLFI